jgi:pre-mRNA-processing factor 40
MPCYFSKAISLFENDERYKALERARDREDLFDSYIVDLERKVNISILVLCLLVQEHTYIHIGEV